METINYYGEECKRLHALLAEKGMSSVSALSLKATAVAQVFLETKSKDDDLYILALKYDEVKTLSEVLARTMNKSILAMHNNCLTLELAKSAYYAYSGFVDIFNDLSFTTRDLALRVPSFADPSGQAVMSDFVKPRAVSRLLH